MPKLFISHAASDKPLVDEFIKLLEGGIGIPSGDIFCFSQKGNGIPPGKDFKKHIKDNLGGSTLVIALISENYYNSAFCMCELGGTWMLSKDFIPVLVPPVKYADMKAVLEGLQAPKIEDSDDLHELRDEINKRLPVEKPHGTVRWDQRRAEFLAALPRALKALGKSPTVPRAQLEKADRRAEDYQQALTEAQVENEKKERLITELKAAKNAEDVNRITFASLPDNAAFDSLINKASSILEKLERTTREALFKAQSGEDYCPDNWADAKPALEKKQVTLNDHNDGVSPNTKKAVVMQADKALDELRAWLASPDRDGDFFDWYTHKYKGDSPDLQDRDFWSRHFF